MPHDHRYHIAIWPVILQCHCDECDQLWSIVVIWTHSQNLPDLLMGYESNSITSWDVWYFLAALLIFTWHLLIAKWQKVHEPIHGFGGCTHSHRQWCAMGVKMAHLGHNMLVPLLVVAGQRWSKKKKSLHLAWHAFWVPQCHNATMPQYPSHFLNTTPHVYQISPHP